MYTLSVTFKDGKLEAIGSGTVPEGVWIINGHESEESTAINVTRIGTDGKTTAEAQHYVLHENYARPSEASPMTAPPESAGKPQDIISSGGIVLPSPGAQDTLPDPTGEMPEAVDVDVDWVEQLEVPEQPEGDLMEHPRGEHPYPEQPPFGGTR